ncbi:MAG: AAA family ATPase [Desulfosarcinaceae bacterium]|nr:AAA family ATPase [Desulfosarcinaceae bacterium]
MICAQCQHENLRHAKFCGQCGQRLGMPCPSCRTPNVPTNNYCSECGAPLTGTAETVTPAQGAAAAEGSPAEASAGEGARAEMPVGVSERKQITAVFSDLTGYTALLEKVDPEDVKEVMTQVFAGVVKVVDRYEGTIERILGDGILALFGTPIAHEDDAVRAIRATLAIHKMVREKGREFSHRLDGHRLSMHTGINSGLVVTGRVDLEHGRHGIAGDTINTASRLADLAGADEIVVGPGTYRLAMGHIDFEAGPSMRIKGKSRRVQIYKVRGPKLRPDVLHAPSGVRAALVGRQAELLAMQSAYQKMLGGQGCIITLRGDAGTGKSRLLREFKSAVDAQGVQWVEGRAYAYTQSTPYYPLIDMINRLWGIEESDPADRLRDKIADGVQGLMGPREDILPYLGSLYGGVYPEIEGTSPEVWHERLYEATYEIMLALARQAPTVFCVEDLHWADSGTLSLLKKLSDHFRAATVLICTYRTPFNLFSHHQLRTLGSLHHDLPLRELSPSETRQMLASMLESDHLPPQLHEMVHQRAGGNPFFLEEVINSLLDAGILTRQDNHWQLAEDFRITDIPASVHGVISARLDRLEKRSKRILQEASVIGRAFLFAILERITGFEAELERRFNDLERIDLVHARTIVPELEFAFKHALTQEVSYKSLLRSERMEIHERIASVMEVLFEERIAEFYETLAFHFQRGRSPFKAVHYLVRSGVKSLKRCALVESQAYFEDAFTLLKEMDPEDPAVQSALVEVLFHWSFVFYYLGDFKNLLALLESHRQVAESKGAKALRGRFYAVMGCALWHRARFRKAETYLLKAHHWGHTNDDPLAIGYACAWLSWVQSELGKFEAAMRHAEEGMALYDSGRVEEHYIYFNSLGGSAWTHLHAGHRAATESDGRKLLQFGRKHSNVRSMVLGHCAIGWSHMIEGDYAAALERSLKARKISVDPWYTQFPTMNYCYIKGVMGEVADVAAAIGEMQRFSDKKGAEFSGDSARFLSGLLQLAKGEIAEGVAALEGQLTYWENRGSRLRRSTFGLYTAKAYLELFRQRDDLPMARAAISADALGKSCLRHLRETITLAGEMGSRSILGQAHLALGILYGISGDGDRAQAAFVAAEEHFQHCGARCFLAQLKTLKSP